MSQGTVIWAKLLELFEDKLQMGLLEQARAVQLAEIEGTELALTVTTREALEFFSSEVNQQRLIIMSRPVVRIDRITVCYADPIES